VTNPITIARFLQKRHCSLQKPLFKLFAQLTWNWNKTFISAILENHSRYPLLRPMAWRANSGYRLRLAETTNRFAVVLAFCFGWVKTVLFLFYFSFISVVRAALRVRLIQVDVAGRSQSVTLFGQVCSACCVSVWHCVFCTVPGFFQFHPTSVNDQCYSSCDCWRYRLRVRDLGTHAPIFSAPTSVLWRQLYELLRLSVVKVKRSHFVVSKINNKWLVNTCNNGKRISFASNWTNVCISFVASAIKC